MAPIDIVFYLLFTSAGVGLIITIVIDAINDLLLKRDLSVIRLDSTLHPLFRTSSAAAKEKEGFAELIVASWLFSLGFMILWLLPSFHSVTTSIVVAAFIYCAIAYAVVMLILLPIVHMGFFGSYYNKKTWSSAAIIFLLYAILLSILIPLIV